MPHNPLRILPEALRAPDWQGSTLPSTNEDRFGRRIDYMRIAVTDRCNLRCVYCMPEQGVKLAPRDALLRFEEFWRVAASARRLGFQKFRVTGGEPLVVRNILVLLEGLRRATRGATLGMTTNGLQLEELAEDLQRLGVQRLNISLDTLDRDRFTTLTRRDELPAVLRGLDRALEVGFERVKINAVIVRGFNEEDLIPLVSLARDRPIDVRLIEQMPLCGQDDRGFLGAEQIVQRLRQHFELNPVAPEDTRAAAQLMFRSPQLRGFVGVIAPRSQKFCSTCNRMRLTPNGELKGCLLSEGTLDLRAALREGVTDDELDQLLRYAIGIKPLEYRDEGYGLDRSMSAIGG